MNYYIQGNAANAQQIKAAFEKLGVASNADKYNFKNRAMLYFTAGGMIHITDANGSWANIIKTHPDYKELELPVEPKFKVGDWVVRKDGETFYGGNYAEQITLIEIDEKGKCIWFSSKTWAREDAIRPWTIADAKDGDVLTLNGNPFIYSPETGRNYCCVDFNGALRINHNLVFEGNCVLPATKEQRDLLFAKMKEAGYQWDAKKKELRKIKPHYDIANFKPFDKVLVRDSCCEKWVASLFSNYDEKDCIPHHFICIDSCYTQCIPFEGNERLLGTTDMPSEEYINW